MTWEEALVARLNDDAAVAAATNGVSWSVRPQSSALPWLVLHAISDPRDQHLKGFYTRRGSRVQFDVMSETRAAVAALREAAIAAITPAGEFHGITFGRALIEPVTGRSQDSETAFVHRDIFDAILWHD